GGQGSRSSTASVSLFLFAGLAVLMAPGADLCGPQARRAGECGVLSHFCLSQRGSGGGGDEFGGEGLAQASPPRLVRLGQSAADDDDLGGGDVGDAAQGRAEGSGADLERSFRQRVTRRGDRRQVPSRGRAPNSRRARLAGLARRSRRVRRRGWAWAGSRRWVARSAGPEAIASTWPVAPHGQGRPAAAGAGRCPMCPAAEFRPVTSRPSQRIPPPMPVPAATRRELLVPRDAPDQASPRAWAWTSLTARTRSWVWASSSATRRVPAQPDRESVAETTVPVTGSMTPAAPTPI